MAGLLKRELVSAGLCGWARALGFGSGLRVLPSAALAHRCWTVPRGTSLKAEGCSHRVAACEHAAMEWSLAAEGCCLVGVFAIWMEQT
jgi:hypothetical protein